LRQTKATSTARLQVHSTSSLSLYSCIYKVNRGPWSVVTWWLCVYF